VDIYTFTLYGFINNICHLKVEIEIIYFFHKKRNILAAIWNELSLIGLLYMYKYVCFILRNVALLIQDARRLEAKDWYGFL
jgi:hypothetical protein